MLFIPVRRNNCDDNSVTTNLDFGVVCREARVDVLSEVLKVVKLQRAMFYSGEFSSPWSLCSPASARLRPIWRRAQDT